MGDVAPENILDKWILARRDELVKTVTKHLESYEPMAACMAIEEFVADLSNWYVRRSRRRFWDKGEADESAKQQAYGTLYSVLKDTVKLMAPLMPFLSEAIYQNLKAEGEPESVHLTDWPKTQTANAVVLSEMQTLRQMVETGLNLREQANVKIRQPLASFAVTASGMNKNLENILKDELNVKNVSFGAAENKLDTNITDALRIEGVARELVRSIQIMRKDQGFEVQDRIGVKWQAEATDVAQAFLQFADYISTETLAVDVKQSELPDAPDLQVNGNVVKLRLTKEG